MDSGIVTKFDNQSERITFAIISHPDAGKTTVTEKLLLFGGAIQMAGAIKAKKSSRHATSDWMKMEQERGISVTSSVMQFPFKNKVINLLDTPGHEDFSEDTYRTLTAVDSTLMVIDAAKGVEERTIKLMDICRLRQTPILSFINKLDRESRSSMELLDEIEKILKIKVAPITWPIGMGKSFQGVYDLYQNKLKVFDTNNKENKSIIEFPIRINELKEYFKGNFDNDIDEMELSFATLEKFSQKLFLKGQQTPVFFGSAINNFGISDLLNGFVSYAPPPLSRKTLTREVLPHETKLSGFVFKIQANMDLKHRDRIAFMRIVSGRYTPSMKLHHIRLKKNIKLNQAITFMAQDRQFAKVAVAGDIIGIHNHGSIKIGDTFSEGEELKFIGIPSFSSELFRRVYTKDTLKIKALKKGLDELSEEGATQFFRPLKNNELILGAVGVLQFEVVQQRLKDEYKVEAILEPLSIYSSHWVVGNKKAIAVFSNKQKDNIALDANDRLVYLSNSHANYNLIQERFPEINFKKYAEL